MWARAARTTRQAMARLPRSSVAAVGLVTAGVHFFVPASIAAPLSSQSLPVGTLRPLRDELTLKEMLLGRSVVLLCRGHSHADAQKARHAFAHAVSALLEENKASHALDDVRFYIVDNTSGASAADLFHARLGVTYDKPFVMILDRYLDKEVKYLSPDIDTPTSSSVRSMVRGWLDGTLKPSRLGQQRPPCDRSAHCKVGVSVCVGVSTC